MYRSCTTWLLVSNEAGQLKHELKAPLGRVLMLPARTSVVAAVQLWMLGLAVLFASNRVSG